MDKMDIKNRLLSIVVFEDNEWLDKYYELINEGKKKEKNQIARCCRGESKTAGSYHWEYA